MSADQYRRQLEQKRKQRRDAEDKERSYSAKEKEKRGAATTARQAAKKTKTASTVRSKDREAEKRDKEAATAAKEATRWGKKASAYSKEEATLLGKLSKAEQSEAATAERRNQRDQLRRDREAAAESAAIQQRLDDTDAAVSGVVRELRAPKPEHLRVLMLGAASGGDLRVGREQSRIMTAVRSSLHRDLVDLDPRPAATTDDLLDGMTRFRPHIVHFSGHSTHDLIVFEDDSDPHHEGVIVTAKAFAAAVAATDDQPLLVLLNSCHSASQIEDLTNEVVPFAIGMADEIGDTDAITYAAQFYAALANGQSILAAHLSAQAALQLSGLSAAELPTLACASDVDPATTILVKSAPDNAPS